MERADAPGAPRDHLCRARRAGVAEGAPRATRVVETKRRDAKNAEANLTGSRHLCVPAHRNRAKSILTLASTVFPSITRASYRPVGLRLLVRNRARSVPPVSG